MRRSWIGNTTKRPIAPFWPLLLVALPQLVLGGRVVVRLIGTAGGQAIRPTTRHETPDSAVSVVVPVLNEYERLDPCLEAISALGPEVAEILVVDGGSTDGTQDVVERMARRDGRVRLVDATPIPGDWNGKAWGLEVGLRHADPRCAWFLCLDADVRVEPPLVTALLARAHADALDALSAATRQQLAGPGMALLHPAFLATLVYRFGSPGTIARSVHTVQANGQCFLARQESLRRVGGFAATRASRCEDITLARALVANRCTVGFYEVGGLAQVRMYEGWRDTWRNWPRSLPMRDQYTRWSSLLGLAEVSFVQALPLPILAALTRRHWRPRALALLNVALLTLRLGILGGTARAYSRPPWTFWLSPFLDLPVTGTLWVSLLRRKHRWRGRVLVEEKR